MKKLLLLNLVLGLLTINTTLFAQTKFVELDTLRSTKNQIEANTQSIISTWKYSSVEFAIAKEKYNELSKTYIQTTLYLSYFKGLTEKQQKKESVNLDAKLNEFFTKSQEYNSYLEKNHDKAKDPSRSGLITTRIPLIISNQAIIVQVIDVIKKAIPAKKIKVDYNSYINELMGIHLPSWNDYKFVESY